MNVECQRLTRRCVRAQAAVVMGGLEVAAGRAWIGNAVYEWQGTSNRTTVHWPVETKDCPHVRVASRSPRKKSCGLSSRPRFATLRSMDHAQLKARIAQIFRDLDAYSYYELLKVAPQATHDEIREAFHRMAMSMHPDRYQNFGDEELREQMYAIYKRVTEGYRVLTNHAMRREYDEALSRGELRLQQTERKRSGPKLAAEDLPPAARKFFLLAEDAERRGDKKTAKLNYKFAKDMAEDHPLILERLAALEADEG